MSTDDTSIGRAGRTVRRAGHSNLLIGAIASVAILGLLMTFLVYGKQIHDNHAANLRTNRAVAQIIAERAERRAQITNEIRGLACFLVSQTPDDPKRPVIHEFRTRYACPPYSRRNARRALKHIPPAQPQPTVTTPAPAATSRPGPRGKHRGHHHHHRR